MSRKRADVTAPDDDDFDYYEILEITKTATSAEIKKAYRKQALTWHPDKNPENKEEADRKFKQISEAYQVLSDKEKKRIYDRYGREGLKPTDGGGNSGGAAFNGGSFDGFQTRWIDPMELFSQFFGGSDPFADFFGARPGRPGHQHSQSRHAASSAMMDPFGGFGFPMFGFSNHASNGALVNGFQDDFFGNGSAFGNNGGFSFSSSSSFGGGGANVTMSSTSSSIVNGKHVETTKRVDNGVETVIVKENGRTTSYKVNGQDQLQQQVGYSNGGSQHRGGEPGGSQHRGGEPAASHSSSKRKRNK